MDKTARGRRGAAGAFGYEHAGSDNTLQASLTRAVSRRVDSRPNEPVRDAFSGGGAVSLSVLGKEGGQQNVKCSYVNGVWTREACRAAAAAALATTTEVAGRTEPRGDNGACQSPSQTYMRREVAGCACPFLCIMNRATCTAHLAPRAIRYGQEIPCVQHAAHNAPCASVPWANVPCANVPCAKRYVPCAVHRPPCAPHLVQCILLNPPRAGRPISDARDPTLSAALPPPCATSIEHSCLGFCIAERRQQIYIICMSNAYPFRTLPASYPTLMRWLLLHLYQARPGTPVPPSTPAAHAAQTLPSVLLCKRSLLP
eukprot:307924-Chlamydomonas_euryale.AAC.14